MSPAENTPPRIVGTHDSSTYPSDGEVTGTNPHCENEQCVDQDSTNKTENGGGDSELRTGDGQSSTTYQPPPAAVSPPLISPGFAGPVAGSGILTQNDRDRKPSPPALTSSDVRPGAVAVGGASIDEDFTPTEVGSEGGTNAKRDMRATKRRQRRYDDNSRNDRVEDDQAVPVPSGLLADEMSYMNTDENPSKSVDRKDVSASEDSCEGIGKIDSAQEDEDIIAEISTKPPATIAAIPPHYDDSFEFVYDSTSRPDVIPMVSAELVTPPVEAYHVSIDEEHAVHAVNGLSPFEFDLEESEGTGKTKPHWYDMKVRRFSLRCSIIIALITVAATFAITIPLTQLKSVEVSEGQIQSSPTPAPTFPYPCYTSTYDILVDQIKEDPMPDAFVICPNTTIQVGTFRNPAANDFEFVDGDFSMMAVRSNVLIQCGLDGKRENNCTLDGGFMQVLTLADVPIYDFEFSHLNTSIDNFTIRGVTFTGQPINSGPFEGMSVTLSHPGKNTRFEDCLWKDFSAQNGLIGVYKNSFQDILNKTLQDNSIDVTFSDCEFDNIVYDRPLISAIAQGIALERTMFNGISLSILAADKCRFETDDFVLEYKDGCAGLLYCGPGSVCSMSDVCVFDFAYGGPSIVNVAENAIFTSNNLFLSNTTQNTTDSESDDDTNGISHNSTGVSLGTPPSYTCGLTFIALADSTVSNCTDIFTAQTCTLDLV